jgi:hypothetical protein
LNSSVESGRLSRSWSNTTTLEPPPSDRPKETPTGKFEPWRVMPDLPQALRLARACLADREGDNDSPQVQ